MSEGIRQQKWISTTLSAFGQLHCGQSPSSNKVNSDGEGVPYVSGPEQWDGTRLHLSKWTTAPCRMAPEESIFITVKGAGVGTMFPGTAGAIGRDIYAFEPSRLMDAQFVFRALQYSISDVIARAHGDIPGLTKNHILDHQVMIPGRKAQQAVASKIDELFSSIDEGERALERVRKLVERYRQSVLKAAVTGELTREWREQHAGELESGEALLTRILEARRQAWEQSELAKMQAKRIRPTNDGWKKKYEAPAEFDVSQLPQLPDKWVWCSLGQLGEVSGGLTKNKSKTGQTLTRSYLRVANVYRNRLDLAEVLSIPVTDGELERLTLQKNDLLVVEGNGSLSQIGRAALWDGSIENCIHQNHIIKVRLSSPELAWYALIWCMSPNGRQLIEDLASSTAGLHTLSISKIQAIPIPLPTEQELSLIRSEFDRLDSIITAQLRTDEVTSKKADALKQAILKSAISGQLVPQDPADEPASVLLDRIAAERAATPKRPATKQPRASKIKSKPNA